jgi:hypothetical protein
VRDGVGVPSSRLMVSGDAVSGLSSEGKVMVLGVLRGWSTGLVGAMMRDSEQ